jgi:hypothetical protein
MQTIFDPESVPIFYQNYVRRVQQYTLQEALNVSIQKYVDLVKKIPEEKGLHKYSEDKWTIKELLVHVLDAERIFAYRALRFARNDKTMLPGFEENSYVPESGANQRSISEIAESMRLIRMSTVDLFKTFSSEMLLRRGKANNTEVSVEALGYIIAGHLLHHCSILEERYLQRG